MNGSKPKYHIPTMAEVESTPWNGYNVVSTFSGGGGSCLGYRMAGYHVLYASEFVEEAQKTYRANHPNTVLDTRDIRTVKPEEILEMVGMKVGEIDLLDGSPPCCAFSTSGRRDKTWNQERSYSDGKVQRIEDLFYEYIRILDGIQPKCFIAENVSGLIKGKAVGYFKEYITLMKQCGYRVKAQLVNAKWLGVPQARERLIFMGVRNDLNMVPVYPKPFPYYYTIADAFADLKNDEEEAKMLTEYMAKTKQGWVLRKLRKNPSKPISAANVMNGSWFNTKRESMYCPCSTLTSVGNSISASGSCHPLYDRKLTIAEMKRITGLPDDFILTGNRNQQGERIGRMVPPIMMMNIAKTVQTEVLDRL